MDIRAYYIKDTNTGEIYAKSKTWSARPNAMPSLYWSEALARVAAPFQGWSRRDGSHPALEDIEIVPVQITDA